MPTFLHKKGSSDAGDFYLVEGLLKKILAASNGANKLTYKMAELIRLSKWGIRNIYYPQDMAGEQIFHFTENGSLYCNIKVVYVWGQISGNCKYSLDKIQAFVH